VEEARKGFFTRASRKKPSPTHMVRDPPKTIQMSDRQDQDDTLGYFNLLHLRYLFSMTRARGLFPYQKSIGDRKMVALSQKVTGTIPDTAEGLSKWPGEDWTPSSWWNTLQLGQTDSAGRCWMWSLMSTALPRAAVQVRQYVSFFVKKFSSDRPLPVLMLIFPG
jgi:hypothetical protein